MYTRNKTRPIKLGNLVLGNNNPIRVQSMLKVPLTDIERATEQASELERVGCEIIRTAIPDRKSIPFLTDLLSATSVPIVADIHFDYRLALMAIEKGVAGLRINPGNIGSPERIQMVVDAAKIHLIPIRIGVNAGSIEPKILKQFKGPCPQAMVQSALNHIKLLEKRNFDQIKISLKASSVNTTVEAYRELAKIVDYPLHLGITEAGPPGSGTIKTAVGLGILLDSGLGDTIRVSLTGPPQDEVKIGYEILKSLGLRVKGPTLISCPTCGRCQYDILNLINAVQAEIKGLEEPLTIAVMGCEVNGPGEAREADIGIAGGRESGLLFIKGNVIGKYQQSELFEAFQSALKTVCHNIKDN